MSISWVLNGNPIPSSTKDLTLHTNKKVPLIEWSCVTLTEGSQYYDKVLRLCKKKVKPFEASIVEKHSPTYCYNCHGLTFGNRRGWLNDAEFVLSEENYSLLSNKDDILSGDIIAYYEVRGGNKELTHTGIVVDNNGYLLETILDDSQDVQIDVLSKWGALGEFIHSHTKNPYFKNNSLIDFFRFNRTSY